MKKKNLPTIEEPKYYDKFNACSACECTGLITVPPETEDERQSYKDIYDYEVNIDDIK